VVVSWSVERAANTASSSVVQNMSIDHGRRDVGVSEQFLDRPDVVAVLQQEAE